MSNNNDGGAGCGFLVLIIAFDYVILWIIAALAVAAYAVICFWAIVLTLISVFAWNRPLRFFHLGITPYQARGLICFGGVGMVLLPAFALFCEYIFEFQLDPKWWFYIWLGDYSGGCVGFCRMQTFSAQQVEYFYERKRLQALPPPPPTPLLPAPSKTFDYAEWQDPQDWSSR